MKNFTLTLHAILLFQLVLCSTTKNEASANKSNNSYEQHSLSATVADADSLKVNESVNSFSTSSAAISPITNEKK